MATKKTTPPPAQVGTTVSNCNFTAEAKEVPAHAVPALIEAARAAQANAAAIQSIAEALKGVAGHMGQGLTLYGLNS